MSLYDTIEKKILNSAPVNFIAEKSKHISLPGFRGVSLYDVWMFFLKQVKTVGMTERASAIAFNFTMAIPPAIIFLFTLIPHIPISDEVINELYTLIRDIIPGQKNNSPLIGFLDDFLNNRLIALRLTMTFYFLLLVAIFVIAMRSEVLIWLDIKNERALVIIKNLRWLVIILLFFYIISFIYKYAPAVPKKWKLITPGSILATFMMLVFTMFFSWWINNFANYNQLYGPISTVLVLMLLIYFNSLVLLIGFELNVSISSLRKIADERNKNDAGGDELS